ncbi:MAG: thioredoxin family protein [Bacteroidales bacterium]
MKTLRKSLVVFLAITAVIIYTDCSGQTTKNGGRSDQAMNKVKYKVTFIELGSVRCIPCQQMQPVMKSIREKYPTQVNVVFHDVWTEAGSPFAKQFGIEAIPTQVFLDKDGEEFYRHVGFFPEEELVKVLKQKGVK